MSLGKLLRIGVAVLCAPFIVLLLYLGAATMGAVIPATLNAIPSDEEGGAMPVYLVGTLLHVDIAIPVNASTHPRLEFLREHGFPLDAPDLQYVLIGWGSRAFYPETASLSDIKPSTAWTALSGDKAVLHFAPAVDLSTLEGVRRYDLSPERVTRLLDHAINTLDTKDGKAQVLEGKGYGFGDLFFEAKGRFNLLNPCNVWVSSALANAGLASGIWTPTSHSIWLNDYLYN